MYQQTMSEKFLFDEGGMESTGRAGVKDPFGDVPENIYTAEIDAALAANPEILGSIAEAMESGGDSFNA